MEKPRPLNLKTASGTFLEASPELFDGMQALIEPLLAKKYAYELDKRVDAVGNLTDLRWWITSEEWHMQIDAVKRRGKFTISIVAHPEAENEVRSIGRALINAGATWRNGISPSEDG